MGNVQALRKDPPPVPAGYDYAEELQALNQGGLTRAEIARLVGYSESALSQYMNQKYEKGDLLKLNAAIGKMLEAEKLAARYRVKQPRTILTKQVQECFVAIDLIRKLQAAGEHAFGIITSEAGLGKSEALKEYARQHRGDTILIVCNTYYTPTRFLQFFWRHLPGVSKTARAASGAAMIEDIINQFRGRNYLILMDEAHKLMGEGRRRSLRILEDLYDIQDQTGLSFILAGNFIIEDEIGLNGKIPANAQIYSRAPVHCVVTEQIERGDFEQVIALYGVTDPAMVAWLYERCNVFGRRYRWIAHILTLAQSICIDRQIPLSIDMLELVYQLMRQRHNRR